MEPEGLFIAGWPWGLALGPGPGESPGLLINARQNGMDEVLGFGVPLGG
jgi:hypothetical protein